MTQSTDVVETYKTSFLIASIFWVKGEPSSLAKIEAQVGGCEDLSKSKYESCLGAEERKWTKEEEYIRWCYEPTLVSDHEYEATQVRMGLFFLQC